jgi:predicted MFS family arabinose efflux permease
MTLAHDSVALVILWSSILFAGVGAAFASIPNLIVVAVDAQETGEATGTNTVVRNIGSAIGAQIAGTIIAGNVLANGLPSDKGFTIAFLIGTAGALVAAASVLFIPGRVSDASAHALQEPVAGNT